MGKPYAGFDEAGAGNGLIGHRASPRPYLWGGRSGNRRLYPEFLDIFLVAFYDCPNSDLRGAGRETAGSTRKRRNTFFHAIPNLGIIRIS